MQGQPVISCPQEHFSARCPDWHHAEREGCSDTHLSPRPKIKFASDTEHVNLREVPQTGSPSSRHPVKTVKIITHLHMQTPSCSFPKISLFR